MAGLGETAHFIRGYTFFDACERFVIATFVTDEEQAKTVIFETFDRVVIEIRATVAAPSQTEGAELLRDFTGAREVCGKSIVIEEKFTHLRKDFLHVSHLVGNVLW